jgi:hypothetical protein
MKPRPLWLNAGWRSSLLDPVPLEPLALKLAGAADGGGLFAGALFRRLLVVTAQLHFAVHALALQLLLERAQSLINIVVANHDLHKPDYLEANIGNRNGAESALDRLQKAAR